MLDLFSIVEVIAPMSEAEARQCVDEIRTGIVNVGRRLLELYERRGWEALGYVSWRECAKLEFGFQQSHVYRLLEAAEVERNISPMGEIERAIPERQLRPLVPLSPDLQREAWHEAVDTAPNGKVTAAHVQSVVDRMTEPEPRPMAHVGQNSGNSEWYTPLEYIEAARVVMGTIDLDPASTEVANSVVGAAKFYTKEDDGLLYDWHGKVWMNPPYAQPHINYFVNRLREEHEAGRVTEAIVLVNNATETTWFHNLMLSACAVCFPLARVKFWSPDRESATPLQGQAVVYLGPQPAEFIKEFQRFGWCAEVA